MTCINNKKHRTFKDFLFAEEKGVLRKFEVEACPICKDIWYSDKEAESS